MTLIILFLILTTCLWFWAIIDITKSRFKNQNTNTIWFLIVLFFPVFGSLFYFQLKKNFILVKNRRFNPNFSRSNN